MTVGCKPVWYFSVTQYSFWMFGKKGPLCSGIRFLCLLSSLSTWSFSDISSFFKWPQVVVIEQGCSYSDLGETESYFLNSWILGSCFSQLWRDFASWPPLTNIFLSVCEHLFVSRIAEPVEYQNSAHMFISSESVINFLWFKDNETVCVWMCTSCVYGF